MNSNYDLDQRGPGRRQRPLIACVECRTLKIRCKDNEDQVTPCNRCTKLGIVCDYTRKKRGRKRPSAAVPSATPSRSYDPLFGEPAAVVMTDRLVAQSVDVTSLLDPSRKDVNAGASGAAVARNGILSDDDPINLGILSLAEAEHLINMFYNHLHVIMALLDPQLHTLAYLRQTSPLLFTAILASITKFFLRRLRPTLSSHAQILASRAVATGECNIGVIQALIVLGAWKEPTDRSSWVKLGIAIRLGFQMGLHRHRSVPLPADERQARIWADSERTWICLSCTDRTYADVFGLPGGMRPEHLSDTTRWAEETARINPEDMRHACSMDSSSTYLMWMQIRSSGSDMDPVSRLTILRTLHDQFDQHLTKWFPPDPATGRFSALQQTILKWFDLNHLIKIRHEMLTICPPHEQYGMRLALLQTMEMFATQTEVLGAGGQLRYLVDTSATHISSIATMLKKLFVMLDDAEQRRAAALLQRICTCCDQVATGDSEASCAYVARFVHRVLRDVTAETIIMASTRAASPVPGQGVIDSLPGLGDPTWIDDIDAFLRTTEPSLMPWDQSADDQFWANMNWFEDGRMS